VSEGWGEVQDEGSGSGSGSGSSSGLRRAGALGRVWTPFLTPRQTKQSPRVERSHVSAYTYIDERWLGLRVKG
jgi:hypothetical protein